MKKFFTKAALSALLLTGFATPAFAQEFPEPVLFSPVMGVSMFSTVTITWQYKTLTISDNPMVTITTPSGDSFTVKGFLETADESDQGGNFETEGKELDNALTASYYMTLYNQGYNDFAQFIEEGIYTISVPEGTVFIDGQPNPACELIYDLGNILTMDPATYELMETDNEKSLVISWGGQELFKTRQGNTGMGGYLRNVETGAENVVMGTSFSFNEDNTALIVQLTGLVENDITYDFEFIEGLIRNESGYVNPAQIFTFTPGEAGIESLVDIDGQVKVYNLHGVKVLEGDAHLLNTLTKGVYIINGRKVGVR